MKKIIDRLIIISAFCLVVGAFYVLSFSLRVQTGAIAFAKKTLIRPNGHIMKSLFSQQDNVKLTLLGLIEAERRSIHIASFRLTDRDIAQALVDASRRGVKIYIVSDRGCPESEYSKIPLLAKERRIIINLVPRDRDIDRDSVPLMHDKYMIFEQTISDKKIVWTGSFNFTQSASRRNDENVIVLDDREVYDSYRQNFNYLLEKSSPFKVSGARECVHSDERIAGFLEPFLGAL